MTNDVVAKNPLNVWVLADDRAGNVSQCLGVAEALGHPFEVKTITYNGLAKIPNALLGTSLRGITTESRDSITPPWPDLVIAAGRRTAPVARHIKRSNGGKTFLAQTMYPGNSGAKDFDLIAAPYHDKLAPAPNVMSVIGAPHRVTETKLAEAGEVWRSRFEHLPKPWTALIVGGSTKNRSFSDDMARELGRIADERAKASGGALLISTSRRTGTAANALFDEISCPSFTFKWGDEGDNPYFGFLALADAIVVTGDSVSMACEACASAAPVYIYSPEGFAATKHLALHKDLFAHGYAAPFKEGVIAPDHPPLNAAKEIAAEILKRIR